MTVESRSSAPTGESSATEFDERYVVTTRDGVSFDSRDRIWPMSVHLPIDIGRVRDCFHPSLLPGLDGVLRTVASQHAASTMLNNAHALLHFHRTMFAGGLVHRWDLADLRNYRTKIVAEFGHDGYLIRLRKLLKRWRSLGHEGVSANTASALRQMRLKGAPTGRAVRTLDPEKGPLSQEELQRFSLDLYRAVEEGRVNLEDLSLCIFHVVTGRRSAQSSALKCKDVDRARKGDPSPGRSEGEQLFLLHVPRVKQKGHVWRQTRRTVHLTTVYFALFEAQRSQVQNKFRDVLVAHGFDLQDRDLKQVLEDLALYPNWGAVQASLKAAAELRSESHALALETLRMHSKGQHWHFISQGITRKLQAACKAAGTLASDGKPLNVGGLRLRYTKGTELARQGVGLNALAWLMDHSDFFSAGVYIDNLPEHAAQISAALSGSSVLNRVASLFRGEVVDSEAVAIGGDDPQCSRIHYKGEGTATCGNRKQCDMGDGIPLACYTCDRFQPWVDGPHERLLADLQEERSRNARALGDTHPVTIRRDKTIAAVINVIHLCTARKQQRASLSHSGGAA